MLLHVSDAAGRSGWAYAPVVVTDSLGPAVVSAAVPGRLAPGLRYRYFEMPQPELSGTDAGSVAVSSGVSAALEVTGLRRRDTGYGVAFEGYVHAPDGR